MEKLQQLRSSVVSVFIAEANQMNCQLVENAFKPRRARVSVIGTAISSEETLALLSRMEADVLITSARLQEGPLEGYRLLRQLRSLQSAAHAVMLLESRDRDSVIDAFRCGARGVIFRDEPLATLSKCIHAVDEGQIWVNSEHLGYLLDALGKSLPLRIQNAHGIDLLSKREGDVVRLVAQGLTNREVSNELRLSEHTVRNYLFRVFDKLGVSTRVELALYYIQEAQNDTEEVLPSTSHRASGVFRTGVSAISH
jgi:DNA-binding NarL/FixJ family response regulator